MPNLSLVVCGAPLVERTNDLVAVLQADAWVVTRLLTHAASVWAESTVEPAQFRRPKELKPPRADAFVVCPMTFNTGNKWAAGVADSPALSLLCEALGAGKPIVAVPFFKAALWAHPAWPKSLRQLQDAGVKMVDPTDGDNTVRPVASGAGDSITRAFEPTWVARALRT